jgi:hypothetical protein
MPTHRWRRRAAGPHTPVGDPSMLSLLCVTSVPFLVHVPYRVAPSACTARPFAWWLLGTSCPWEGRRGRGSSLVQPLAVVTGLGWHHLLLFAEAQGGNGPPVATFRAPPLPRALPRTALLSLSTCRIWSENFLLESCPIQQAPVLYIKSVCFCSFKLCTHFFLFHFFISLIF